ncbi:unnamed protein product [Chrysoparadoxa australica]
MSRHPTTPFCRKHFGGATIWMQPMDGERVDAEGEDGKVSHPVAAQRIVIFAGKGENYLASDESYLNDMWSLHITNTGLVWEQLLANETRMEPRWKPAYTSYNKSTELVIHGGDDENVHYAHFLSDTWVYSPLASPQLHKANRSQPAGPGKRRGHSMAAMESGLLVIHGGKSSGHKQHQMCDGKTFGLQLDDPNAAWEERAPLPAPCRWGQTMDAGYVGDKEVALLFGGRHKEEGASGYTYYNDLWAYEPLDDSWTLLEAQAKGKGSSASLPPPRDHHASAYVSELNSLYVHGGRPSDGSVHVLGDLWRYHIKNSVWEEIPTSGQLAPSPRFGQIMLVWRGHAGDGEPALALIGGESFSVKHLKKHLNNDVWLHRIKAKAWTPIAKSACSPFDDPRVAGSVIPLPMIMSAAGGILVLGLGLVLYNMFCKKKHRYRALS